MSNVDDVAIVGGGIMGSGIGQTLLQRGYRVSIHDIAEEPLVEARQRIEEGTFGLERAVEEGHLTADQKRSALDRLGLTTEMDQAVDGADLVIEAVSEDLALKGDVFGQLEALTPDVPLYSNTSGFPITGIANAVDDPSRVAGMHFFNPPQVMNLVEIIRTPQTAQAVVETAEALAASLDKTAITVDDAPNSYGFVANRCFFQGLKREAERVVEEGIATEEQVDTALEEGFNLPAGPFSFAGIGNEWE